MADFLLVDDDAQLLRTYQRILMRAGHAVLCAGDLGTARAMLAHTAEGGRTLDGVLLDLQLEDGDGADLLPELRRMHPFAEVAVVSGHADATRVIELASRCALVVPKPLGHQALLALAEELQARRRRLVTVELLAARAGLSARQIELLQQTLAGRDTREIAAAFGCREGSIRTHWNRIFKKTGCHSRFEVMALLGEHAKRD